jgi:hypothetical protein
MPRQIHWRLAFVLCGLIFTACTATEQNTGFRVRVIADGKELAYSASDPVSVSQFLQQTNIQLGPLDRVNPSDFTQITDNMVITIVRVREVQECKDEVVPYKTQVIKSPDLPPGTTKIAQAGTNGSQQVCYDVVYEDNVEKSRTAGNPTLTRQPVVEIVYQGIDKTRLEPVSVAGMLLYISDGQARAIENNSLSDRVLPTGGNLDGHVFSVSPTGRQLLFTRKPEGQTSPDVYNQLWVLLDTSDPQAQPVRLTALDNVLSAEWKPGEPFTFSYSTLQPRDQAPGFQALNDVNTARLDSRTGKLLKVKVEVKSRPTGVYGLWGTKFKWSPDGANLAWAQADGAGIVDFKAGAFKKLFDFKVYSTTLSRNWVWMPNLSWSADGSIVAATVHGKPLGSEQDEFSPVFNVALAQMSGLFEVDLTSQTGMWSAPQFSPLVNTEPAQGYLAYLKSRTPIDSVSSEYDLVVADRDGSNARIVFPEKDKPGLKPIDIPYWSNDPEGLAWSPDGRQIAVIYQGDMWLVDASSGRANQVTLVGNVHHVRWVR